MSRQSLLTRLLLSHILTIIATLLVLGLLSSRLIATYYISMREHELERRARGMAPALVDKGKLRYDPSLLETLDRTAEARLIVADPGGKVLAATSPDIAVGTYLPPGPPPPPPDKHPKFNPKFREPMLAVAVPIDAEGDVIGNLVLGAPAVGINGVISTFQRLMLYGGLAAIALAFPISYVVSRSLARPINEISSITLKMVKGDFGQRIPVKRSDEIGQLAKNFNHMAESLSTLIGALAGEKAQLESLLASMSEGVIALDPESRITVMNQRARNVLGVGPESPDLAVTSLSDLPNSGALSDLVGEMLSTGVNSSMEFRVADRYVLAHGSFINAGDATPSGLVIVLQDITKLMASEELRTRLMANMAHEFRTPLASIKAYAQALVDIVNDESSRRKYIATILDESSRLDNLVTGLLDASASRDGLASSARRPVDVASVISQVAGQYGSQGRTIETEIADDLPSIPGDGDRIKQALSNLVDNAVRYSPEEEPVVVRAGVSGHSLVISVMDHGPGIPRADLPHVWERFYRVEKSRSRAKGGSGLGLAIVKDIVQAHGGTVNAHSIEGLGSVFSMTLPLG